MFVLSNFVKWMYILLIIKKYIIERYFNEGGVKDGGGGGLFILFLSICGYW